MIFGRLLPSRDSTIALAGVMQSLLAVHQLASQGKSNQKSLSSAVQSVLCTNPDNALAIYGDLDSLSSGIECLEQILLGQSTAALAPMEQALLTRYAGQVLRLGSLVRSSQLLSQQLGSALDAVPIEKTIAAEDEPHLLRTQVDALAKIYSAHISTLKPRVMVSGQPTYLRNDQFVADIRCQLLAAVRSAVLWHQCGGRFWQLLFFRGFVLQHARQLAAELPKSSSKATD